MNATDRAWWYMKFVSIGFIVLSMLILVEMSKGCSTSTNSDFRGFDDEEPASESSFGYDQGGEGGEVILHLPIPAGRRFKCTQGAGGSFSHRYDSTSHDLDFDTGNDRDEELFAPIGGVAYVHDKDPRRNFGLHVNIDLGDGTYVVVGHMKQIILKNGQEVAMGQFIGYEGCTGACSGDHVHVGRHKGKASLPAEKGTSILSKFFFQDPESGRMVSQASDSFTCGIKALGDPVEGLSYTSVLPIPLWHPDGTLLKQVKSNAVYKLDQGKLRGFLNEETMVSYGYSFDDLVIMSNEEASCYGNGPVLNSVRNTKLVATQSGKIWVFVEEPEREWYRQELNKHTSVEVLASWGIEADVLEGLPVWNDSDSRFSTYATRSGYLPFRPGTLVREASKSDVYLISREAALPIDSWATLTLMGLASHSILIFDDGLIGEVMPLVGRCDEGVFCIDRDVVETCGGMFTADSIDQAVNVSETQPTIPRSMNLAAGELGVSYQPPSDILPTDMTLEGEIFDKDGQRILAWSTLTGHTGSGQLMWRTRDLEPGDTLQVRVVINAPRAVYLSCEDGDLLGTLWAGYGSTPLNVDHTILPNDRCVHVFRVPGAIQTNPDPTPDPAPDNHVDPTPPTLEEVMQSDNHRLVVGYEPHNPGLYEEASLYGEVVSARGRQTMDYVLLERTSDPSSITWGTNQIEAGQSYFFEVRLINVMEDVSACDESGGRFLATFDDQSLNTSVARLETGCRYTFVIPGAPPVSNQQILTIDWQHSLFVSRLTMSGEQRNSRGDYVFGWRELSEDTNTSQIAYSFAEVNSGDTIRFSVEAERNGGLTWSCLGPYPNYTLTGSATAVWGNQNLPVEVVPDPSGETTGCGLSVRVP